ncbi:O-fucosyltransferase family protein [Thermoclostridium stercorarium]|jgi:hypothetical protein|nr:O-fucosyltransferase family protein [Thermoclostridium stercorarium]UZQ84547.1 O-fucosyltransferase family protein [Thermoclostridium stercorarium]
MEGKKFLLIREIGMGLWNELHHVLAQLLVAEIVGRIPVVYWGKGSLYAPDENVNAFEEFFMPVSDLDIHALAQDKFLFYPERWNSGNFLTVPDFSRNEPAITTECLKNCEADVVVCDRYTDVDKIIPSIPKKHRLFGLNRRKVCHRLICEYIRLKKDLQDSIETFYAENMKGARFLAVHIRSSDKLTEVKHLHELNQRYPREIEKVLETNPGMRIFLMTDCIDILEEYRERYGSLLVYTDCRRVPKDGPGVHYQEYHDNRVKGFEIIRDSWLAAKCNYFIGNGYSNVSFGICELKDWRNDRIKLLY